MKRKPKQAVKGSISPLETLYFPTWDRAMLEGKRLIFKGYKPLIAYAKIKGQWRVEVYE